MDIEDIGFNATSDDDVRQHSWSIRVTAAIFYGLTGGFGLVGNGLVIYVCLRRLTNSSRYCTSDQSKKFPKTNYYILHLAIADGLYLLASPVQIWTIMKHYWTFGSTACKIFMTNVGVSQFTSSFLLTIMAADRYYSVKTPFPRPQLTEQRGVLVAKIVSVTAWFFAAVLTTPIFIYSTTVSEPGQPGPKCIVVWPSGSSASFNSSAVVDAILHPNYYTLYALTCSFLLPLVCIAAAYIGLLFKLRRRDTPAAPATPAAARKDNKNTKVSRLVVALIAVYVVCWLPYWTSQLSLLTSSEDKEKPMSSLVVIIFLFTYYLTFLNAALDPILYSWYNKSVRRNFFSALAFRREPTFTAGAVTVGGHKSRVGVVDVELRDLRPRTPEDEQRIRPRTPEEDQRIEMDGGDAQQLLENGVVKEVKA